MRAAVMVAAIAAMLVEPAARAAPPTSSAPGTAALPGEKEFSSCKKLPANQRVVRFDLRPDVDIRDLVAWLSPMACKPFVLGATPATRKRVTIVAPARITPEEAYRLFVAALDSVGLTVVPSGERVRIVDITTRRLNAVPAYPEADAVADERPVIHLARAGDPPMARDFRGTRGLVEEINRAWKEAEREMSALPRIRQRVPENGSGPVELPDARAVGRVSP